MKNILRLFLASTLMLTVCIVNPLKAQTTQLSTDSLKLIPSYVQLIIEKSCAGCHSEPGKIMALSKVNFTKWNEYTAEKQASKTRAICSEVTKGQMPPKKYRENNPDAIPTAEELKILCDWMQTMQAAKQ